MIPANPLFHKPQSIIASKNIIYATVFLGILILILTEMTTGFRFYSNTQVWAISIIVLVVVLVLTKLIGLGRKWARLIFLILMLLLALLIPLTLIPLFKASFLIEMLFILLGILQMLALKFLFSKKSTEWFNRVRSTDPQ
jgi:hypothetical protein